MTHSMIGYCPICQAPGISREKRPDGNDHCSGGHTYPSVEAVPRVGDSSVIAREVLRRIRRDPLTSTFTETVKAVDLVKELLPTMAKDVKTFHEKFRIDYKGKPRALDFELMQFRLKFLREEMTEYEKHADQALFELDKKTRSPQHQIGDFAFDPVRVRYHLAGMIDALVDLVYVALGTAHLQGFDFETAWARVHDANMQKERPEGEARTAEERIKLKMVKPLGWVAPDHFDEVRDNAHTD